MNDVGLSLCCAAGIFAQLDPLLPLPSMREENLVCFGKRVGGRVFRTGTSALPATLRAAVSLYAQLSAYGPVAVPHLPALFMEQLM